MADPQHDDFCPVTRFHCSPVHCTCGAAETAKIITDVTEGFREDLKRILGRQALTQEQT